MSLHLRLIAVLTIVCSHIQDADALLNNCYGSSGAQVFKFFACQPQASESSCCEAGDICYSNGLCAPGPTENVSPLTPFFIDGCTDTSFAAPNCIPNCLTINGNGVQTCASAGPNHYCCYGFNGCNCSDPNVVFTLQAATVVTTINPSATFTQSSASTSTSSSSTTTTTSSTTPSSSASTSPTAAAKSTNGVAIGVGVGVGTVAVGALAGLAYFFWRRQKSRANTAKLSAEGHPPASVGSPHEIYSQSKPQGYPQQGGYPPQEYPATPMNELSTDHHYQPPGELSTDQHYQHVGELPGRHY